MLGKSKRDLALFLIKNLTILTKRLNIRCPSNRKLVLLFLWKYLKDRRKNKVVTASFLIIF